MALALEVKGSNLRMDMVGEDKMKAFGLTPRDGNGRLCLSGDGKFRGGNSLAPIAGIEDVGSQHKRCRGAKSLWSRVRVWRE